MKSYKYNQSGIALIAALFVIALFTIMGMGIVQKAKTHTFVSGAENRRKVVFAAAEQTLVKAARYLDNINGTPFSGDGSKGKDSAQGFEPENINNMELLHNPDASIVWKHETLSNKFCKVDECKNNIDFLGYMDDDKWDSLAITYDFSNASEFSQQKGKIAKGNYLKEVKSYAFIQELRPFNGNSQFQGSSSSMSNDALGASVGGKSYYLITVKASGFPPGTEDKDKIPNNARENIILQAAFGKI